MSRVGVRFALKVKDRERKEGRNESRKRGIQYESVDILRCTISLVVEGKGKRGWMKQKKEERNEHTKDVLKLWRIL